MGKIVQKIKALMPTKVVLSLICVIPSYFSPSMYMLTQLLVADAETLVTSTEAQITIKRRSAAVLFIYLPFLNYA